ncbi:hypothetical protein Bxe_A3002 [Paraburkholderia xenovorans LB400]|uniref:Uncharacterized protein n=1 Tax=Paraburkholderia xenovorans (strain LB400) TaxID=266265 RepID=Q141L2_PARXL|nr:hypothetical protein Bxe_A3002 [Paraburkholderia xenovorans LB400]
MHTLTAPVASRTAHTATTDRTRFVPFVRAQSFPFAKSSLVIKEDSDYPRPDHNLKKCVYRLLRHRSVAGDARSGTLLLAEQQILSADGSRQDTVAIATCEPNLYKYTV